jgi:hypothetical protein
MGAPKGHTKWGGKAKGYKSPNTLDKIAARELVRRKVTEALEPMLDAQIHNARGIGHLMLRDPETGKFERIVSSGDPQVDEARIDAAVRQGKSQCWIYLKDPSVQAFTDLMNRALDKPTEHVDLKATIDERKLSDEEFEKRLLLVAKKLKKA